MDLDRSKIGQPQEGTILDMLTKDEEEITEAITPEDGGDQEPLEVPKEEVTIEQPQPELEQEQEPQAVQEPIQKAEQDIEITPEEEERIMKELLMESSDEMQKQGEELAAERDKLKAEADAETDPEKKQLLAELQQKYNEAIATNDAMQASLKEFEMKYDALTARYTQEVDNRIVKEADMYEVQRIADMVSANPLLKNIVAFSASENTDRLTDTIKTYLKEVSGIDVDAALEEAEAAKAQREMGAMAPRSGGTFGSPAAAGAGATDGTVSSILRG